MAPGFSLLSYFLNTLMRFYSFMVLEVFRLLVLFMIVFAVLFRNEFLVCPDGEGTGSLELEVCLISGVKEDI